MRILTPNANKLPAPEGAADDPETAVTLRFACADDAAQLARLAALDSSRPPAEPVLLALVGGELQAALSLSRGTVVADPFRRTGGLVQLLRARARHLDPSPCALHPTGAVDWPRATRGTHWTRRAAQWRRAAWAPTR